ncbi:MAG TPA: amino acid adenylation domain-containing protein, partial [Longimicrobium sp.]|nr:amino acid adenylation domain-containing protein [Longimicrobium sp.]
MKIRGYRIELGEIEARLAEHAGVREAVVAAREDGSGEPRLVAYCVVGHALDAQALRSHLSERLPEYMVPAAYVWLDALPLTPNGKVDRNALPAPDGDVFVTRGYEAPASETEAALAEIWADVLGVERVGRHDHFFELGGHSLRAVQVVTRVRQLLRAEAALGDVFLRPVLADFARGLVAAARSDLPPIEPVDRAGPLALSFAQRRLWFLEQLGSAGTAYHIPAGLRLRGELDRGALVRALDRIVARHEALRTTFVQADGEPAQRIAPGSESRFHLLDHDLADHPGAESELRRLMTEEAAAPFDLRRGPLIRGRLVRLAGDDHVLAVTMHHIVSDGWSIGVLTRELSALYAAFGRGDADPLPALPVQYADYAAWQRRWVEGDVLQRQTEYWRTTLTGAPELLELPADRPRPARQDHAGAAIGVELDEALTAGLKALGRRHGTTLFMTLLAGWAAVLSRLSGQDDVVVGTPAANRGRAEIEGLIGFFVNTLALRLELSDAPTVAQLLAHVKERALAAQQHQDIPFEQVVEVVQPARSLAHTPLFQVMFSWQSAAGGELELPGLRLAPARVSGQVTAKFDLSLSLAEVDGRVVGGVDYATALYDRETVERWLGYLRRALEAMVAEDGAGVELLPLLDAEERRQVVETWNATATAYPDDVCIHEAFEAQAALAPDVVAVALGGDRLTYAELNARSNRLAHHLRGLGVGPDVRVAVCAERSLEMVVALLAVLKAGGAYVPLDPAYPGERLRYMLADSAPAVLLTQETLAGRFDALRAPVIALDRDAPSWSGQPVTDPARGGLTPDHLAYVIYTSGSTGLPKGVMNAHRGVVNRLLWMQDAYPLERHDAVLQKTTYAFDVSVWEFFWTLGVGARLVMARPEGHRDPGYLAATIRGEGITTVHFVPSMLQHFVEHPEAGACTGLRRVVCSGEALPPALVGHFHRRLPGVELYNLYGPTEAAVDVTAWRCEPARDAAAARVPLGRPVSNTRLYVLDRAGRPAPAGVAGELYIGGVQVARGYHARPALTAERFVPDPFGGPGARLYRTGDLGRWRADGTLEYLGRTDHQVKVRGFRIEPGEIEARLAEHPRVRGVAVVAREDTPGDQRLVAYYEAAEALEAEALKEHLAGALPEHMVPAAYVRLDALPLTPSGKLDRRALPAPDGGAYTRRVYAAPLGEVEEALAEIWAEVLGVERVGRHDHFFELGGHSLLAVTLVERMRRRGLHAEVGTLFTTPTLAALAAAVGAESLEVDVPPNGIPTPCDAITPEMLPLVELSRGEIDGIAAGVAGGAANIQDIYPLAPLQEGILFHSLASAGDPYLLTTMIRFDGRAHLDRYLAALQAVIDRHEVLRTSVAWQGLREPVQVVWRQARLQVEEVELDGGAGDDAGGAGGDVARRLGARFDPGHHRIDLERAPLVRAYTARDGEGYVLLLLLHHLCSDHTSLDVLQREVEAHLVGRAGELPAPLPFRDYVAQARLGVSRGEHEAFFRRLLGDVAEPTAPFGLTDVWLDGSGMDEARLPVDAGVAKRLRGRARALGVNAASLCHVAWARVLAGVSGRDDVVFGTVLFGRMQAGRGADRVVGPFINTLPVRVKVGGDGVEACVRATHRQLAELLRHEHAPLALAQRCSAVEAPAPLFTALLNYRHGGGESTPAADAAREGRRGIHAAERSNYPLTLSVDDLGERLQLDVQVPRSIGAARVCALMHTALESVVEALETAPDTAIGSLDVLPAAERRQVVEEWNATDAAFPGDRPVHERFERQVERTPAAVAVVHEDRSLTYAELNARANRLAHHLRARGVAPGARVAIVLPRSAELVVAELAILKAGAAYVPIDPVFPAERIAFMVADSGSRIVLALAGADLPDLSEVERIDVDTLAEGRTDDPRVPLDGEAAAYVMYTSGSTGQPKGVVVPHRAVSRLVVNSGYADFGAGDRVAFAANPAFDASTMEVWGPLLNGGRIVVIGQDVLLDPRRFGEAL